MLAGYSTPGYWAGNEAERGTVWLVARCAAFPLDAAHPDGMNEARARALLRAAPTCTRPSGGAGRAVAARRGDGAARAAPTPRVPPLRGSSRWRRGRGSRATTTFSWTRRGRRQPRWWSPAPSSAASMGAQSHLLFELWVELVLPQVIERQLALPHPDREMLEGELCILRFTIQPCKNHP